MPYVQIVTVAGARFEKLDIEEQVLGVGGVVKAHARQIRSRATSELVGAEVVLTASHPKFTRAVLEGLTGVRAIVGYGSVSTISTLRLHRTTKSWSATCRTLVSRRSPCTRLR